MTLNGKRILITRSEEQAPVLSKTLVGLGAEPVVVPTIEIVPPQSWEDLDRAIANLQDTDYLILTSVNAVRAFCDRLRALGYDNSALSNLQTVAVGPKSAEALTDRGFHADLVPEDYRAEGIVNLLRDRIAGKQVLYPKAALARDLIPSELSHAGARVCAPVAYDSAVPVGAAENLHQALNEGVDLLTFTASSTVNNFVALLDAGYLDLAKKVPVASIGPLTTATAEKLGFNVVIEPDHSTLDDMLEAIEEYFK